MARPPASTSRKRRPRTPKVTTTFSLPANDTRPSYEKLISLLRQQIHANILKPGDPVPSVRQLIADLGVSHTTVTRALRALVEDGTLETKVGSGTWVAIRRPRKAIGLLGLSKYTDVLKSAFMMRSLNLLQQRVLETGRTLIYRHINPENQLANAFDDLNQVDGLLLVGHVPADATEHLTRAMPRQLPIVGISCMDTGRFPVFTSDNENDPGRLIRYLASLGHEHIATLYMDLPSYLPTSHQRVASVRKALAELKLPHGDGLFMRGSVEEQIGQLLQMRPRPTAIFLASGIHRFPQIHSALRETPLDMQHRTLPAAYDEDLWMQMTPLGIEHVRLDQPLTEIVNASFHCLEQMIQNPSGEWAMTGEKFPSRIVHVKANGDAMPVSQQL